MRESRVFSEIHEVNRLHLSHYRLDTKAETMPIWHTRKGTVVCFGDRGKPEYYRAEMVFQEVLYLDFPLKLSTRARWRLATPEEGRIIFPVESIHEPDTKQARQKSRVYRSDLGFPSSDQPHSLGGSYEDRQNPSGTRTFFIVAASVQIVVYYAGDDLDLYLERLQQGALSDQKERGLRAMGKGKLLKNFFFDITAIGKEKLLKKLFTDITVLNSLAVYDYYFQEISYEQVFIRTGAEYQGAEISFYQVEYMSCPTTYLGFNYWWRIAEPYEAEYVFQKYKASVEDRKRAHDECKVYCIDERLEVYQPRPQRLAQRFYIVAQRVEVEVWFLGTRKYFDRFLDGLSDFQ